MTRLENTFQCQRLRLTINVVPLWHKVPLTLGKVVVLLCCVSCWKSCTILISVTFGSLIKICLKSQSLHLIPWKHNNQDRPSHPQVTSSDNDRWQNLNSHTTSSQRMQQIYTLPPLGFGLIKTAALLWNWDCRVHTWLTVRVPEKQFITDCGHIEGQVIYTSPQGRVSSPSHFWATPVQLYVIEPQQSGTRCTGYGHYLFQIIPHVHREKVGGNTGSVAGINLLDEWAPLWKC